MRRTEEAEDRHRVLVDAVHKVLDRVLDAEERDVRAVVVRQQLDFVEADALERRGDGRGVADGVIQRIAHVVPDADHEALALERHRGVALPVRLPAEPSSRFVVG